jgi:CheY-like chemotaxis protein
MNKSPLIIGDYAAVRRLIREVLRTNFATTLRGGYGMEGVPLAEREKPTIILLDLDTAMSAGLQTSRLLGCSVRTSASADSHRDGSQLAGRHGWRRNRWRPSLRS